MSVVPEEQEQVLPVMFDHCCLVYQTMFKRSKKVPSGEVDGDELLVYEGHLTRLFTDLRLSVPYYSSVMKELKRMGCVRQLRRGGGNAPSQWELVTEPTELIFRDKTTVRPTGRSKTDNLEQRFRDLNTRLLTIEKALGLVSGDT